MGGEVWGPPPPSGVELLKGALEPWEGGGAGPDAAGTPGGEGPGRALLSPARQCAGGYVPGGVQWCGGAGDGLHCWSHDGRAMGGGEGGQCCACHGTPTGGAMRRLHRVPLPLCRPHTMKCSGCDPRRSAGGIVPVDGGARARPAMPRGARCAPGPALLVRLMGRVGVGGATQPHRCGRPSPPPRPPRPPMCVWQRPPPVHGGRAAMGPCPRV